MNEEKLKIENDTFALKRDYKHALERLEIVKTETNEILSIKDKALKDLDEAREEFKNIKNEISQEKLDWTTHRVAELEEIDSKKDKVESILSREESLNTKEIQNKAILDKNTEILNEKKRLELKLKDDMTALEVKEREIDDKKKEIETKIEDLEINKINFKSKVVEVLKQIELI